VHSYQPSPFFVLDEIDDALDAENVNTVAQYIRARKVDLQVQRCSQSTVVRDARALMPALGSSYFFQLSTCDCLTYILIAQRIA
jgi:hypothetical protein